MQEGSLFPYAVEVEENLRTSIPVLEPFGCGEVPVAFN
jgi:hypothetical protein